MTMIFCRIGTGKLQSMNHISLIKHMYYTVQCNGLSVGNLLPAVAAFSVYGREHIHSLVHTVYNGTTV